MRPEELRYIAWQKHRRANTRAHLWRLGMCILAIALVAFRHGIAELAWIKWLGLGNVELVTLVAGVLLGGVCMKRPGDTEMRTR